MKMLFVLLFVSFSAFAGEIQLNVYGRSYVNSCGYFSNESGDYSIGFGSRMLPWGTRVFVVTGWKGFNVTSIGSKLIEQGFEWAYRSEQEAKSVAPFEWRAETHQTLHNRTSNQYLTALQFAIRVEVPGKAPVNYPLIAWAFYEAGVGAHGNSPCVNGEELPQYHLISHKIIERN